MPDIALLLSQKEQEFQQLLKVQAELQRNLQIVNADLLRAEGAIVALRAVIPQEAPQPMESVNGCVSV